jgi:hypothetical protein
MGAGTFTPLLPQITLMMAGTAELGCSEMYVVCSFGATNDDIRTRKGQESNGHLHVTRGKGPLLPIVTAYVTGVHHFDPESMLQ